MPTRSRTEAVLRLYRRLDLHLRTFRSFSGLACPRGCGECCLSDEIEATVLELFPAAALLQREGRLPQTLELLRSDRGPEHCLFYEPEVHVVGGGLQASRGGHCAMYSRRPLVCRLFGFAARLDREGSRQLVTCRRIREALPEAAAAAQEAVAREAVAIPVMGNYTMELFGLDPSLGARLYPVNEALAQALEIVGFDLRGRRRAG